MPLSRIDRKAIERIVRETGGDGPPGPQGDPGAAGTPGATGASGSQGIQGVTGATGSQGTSGTPGSNGVDGAKGVDGVQPADLLALLNYAFDRIAFLETISGVSTLPSEIIVPAQVELLDNPVGPFK